MSLNCAPILVDSHVHLDDERLGPDRQDVINSARSNRIAAQIVPAVSAQHWPRLKLLSDNHEDVHACYGLHPCFYAEHTEEHLRELPLWLGREAAVGVGECGLDYAMAGADKAQQQHLFSAQLALAREFNLPIVIHAVKAVEDVIRMIRASGHYCGMVHSFNGSMHQASRLIDLGYMLSFGGAITYPRAKKLRTMVSQLPLDALLLETDAPDQAPVNHQGQRNETAYLVDIWHTVSEIRPEDPDTIAQTTSINAKRLFRI